MTDEESSGWVGGLRFQDDKETQQETRRLDFLYTFYHFITPFFSLYTTRWAHSR